VGLDRRGHRREGIGVGARVPERHPFERDRDRARDPDHAVGRITEGHPGRRVGQAADHPHGQPVGRERREPDAEQLRDGHEQPPVAEPEPHPAVADAGDARQVDPHQQVVDRVPEVAQLIERQLPQVREQGEEPERAGGNGRPQHGHRDERRARRPPTAADPDADHRADRRARDEVGHHAGAADEESERRRGGHPHHEDAAPLADAEHHERHARRREQSAAQRQEPGQHHQPEREVGEDGRLGQLHGRDGAPATGRSVRDRAGPRPSAPR
jgi:hypothetical protein